MKLIGLSANTIDSHGGWIKDIDEISGSSLRFPIIGDKQRKVAYLYDMLDHQDTTNVDSKGIAFTIRSVFIIRSEEDHSPHTELSGFDRTKHCRGAARGG